MQSLFAVAALLAAPVGAQESSVVELAVPEGPSSGETMPEGAGAGVPPPPCGTQPLTLARMQWPTAALLTEIHARILRIAFDCTVEVQEGDMATTGSSMGANGQPAAAPEMWVSRIPDIWNAAIKAQEVRQAGTSYAEQVFEGWFVPDYAVAAWPEITTIEGLKARAADMGGGAKPRFLSCPIDWGCNLINRNMLRANGLDQLFEIIEPANRFELDTLIAEAVGRQEPILFYYWQPNAILAQFAFRDVALGGYNKDNFTCMGRVACATSLPTGFAPDPVIIALSEWVYIEAPQIASYFQRAKMPFAEMNQLLQQLSQTGASVESVADRFIAERGAIWRPWAGLPVDPAEAAAALDAGGSAQAEGQSDARPEETEERPVRRPVVEEREQPATLKLPDGPPPSLSD